MTLGWWDYGYFSFSFLHFLHFQTLYGKHILPFFPYYFYTNANKAVI